MNGEDMMRGMGQIWDSLIDEAEYETIEKKKGVNYMKYLASAAVYMAITGATVLGTIYYQNQNETPLQLESSESVIKVETVSEGEISTAEINTEAETSLLPMEENEYLAVTAKDRVTGEDVLVILDRDGNTVKMMEGYRLADYKLTGDSAVISGEKPLLLEYISKTCINEQGIYSVPDEGWIHTGIYSLENRDWIQEPYYGNLDLLSDFLCTNRDDKFTQGKLMKLDGTLVAEKAGSALSGIGRFGNLVSDGKNLYDLEGNYLFTFGSEASGQPGNFGASLGDVWDDYLLVSDDSVSENRVLKLMKVDGSTVWTEGSGLILNRHFGDLWSWTDRNKSGLITDMKLNHLITEEEFRQLNVGTEINGMSMSLVSVNEKTGERLIQTSNPPLEYWYYRCDESWNILEVYPKNLIYLEKKDDTTIPWFWQIDEKGIFTVTNLWTGENVSWEQDGMTMAQAGDVTASEIWIKSEGDVITTYYSVKGKSYVSIDTFDGYHKLHTDSSNSITRLEDDLVVVRAYNGVFSVKETLYYFDIDGTYLGDNSNGTLYLNHDMKCVQNQDELVIYDTNGKILLNVLLHHEGE